MRPISRVQAWSTRGKYTSLRMPWLKVNHTRLCRLRAVPIPDLADEVQRGGIPGHPGANCSFSITMFSFEPKIQTPGERYITRPSRYISPIEINSNQPW